MRKVAIIAIRKEGKWLVMQRSGHETMAGHWEFPGGRVDGAEELQAGAIREMMEETGLEAKALVHVGQNIFPASDADEQLEFHYFACTDFDGEIKVCDEHSDFKWLAKQDILKLDKVTYGTMHHLKLLSD